MSNWQINVGEFVVNHQIRQSFPLPKFPSIWYYSCKIIEHVLTTLLSVQDTLPAHAVSLDLYTCIGQLLRIHLLNMLIIASSTWHNTGFVKDAGEHTLKILYCNSHKPQLIHT